MRRCPDPDKEVAAARKAKVIFISNLKEIQTEQVSPLQHEQIPNTIKKNALDLSLQ